MSATFAIANVQHSLQALKELISPERWSETPLPVIVAPGWWMEEVRKELGMQEGYEPDSIHGCYVTRNDNANEPMLVDHDGKTYPILPKWMRAKQVEDTEGGEL